jgi:hypothetical protein
MRHHLSANDRLSSIGSQSLADVGVGLHLLGPLVPRRPSRIAESAGRTAVSICSCTSELARGTARAHFVIRSVPKDHPLCAMRLTHGPRLHCEPCPDEHLVGRRRGTSSLMRGALLLALSAGACKKGSTSEAPTATAAPPAPVAIDAVVPAVLVAEEAVVPDQLTVKVYAHALTTAGRPLKMWTFISDGLARHGQLEVAITVVRRAGEADSAYPQDVFALYNTIHMFAARGQLVPAGGRSELRATAPGLLARPDFHVVYYAPGQLVPGVPLTGNFLTALFLTRDEYTQMREFGQLRVLSWFGRNSGYYPFPPWIDRDRPAVATIAGGVLDMPVGRTALSGMTVTLESAAKPGAAAQESLLSIGDARFVLAIPPDAYGALAEVLKHAAAGAPIALFGELDAGTNGVFAYMPGDDPLALTCARVTSSRIAANFVLLTPQGDNSSRLVDDGLAVMFDAAAWQRLNTALAGHQPIAIPLADGHTLAVEWPDARDERPAASYCLR